MQHRSVHTISLHEQPASWERLHARSPDATLFSSTAWLTILADVFQRRAMAVVAETDERPVAGIPLLLQRRGPLWLSPPLPITLYAGILRSGTFHADLSPLLEEIEHRCHFVSLSARIGSDERGILTGRGWRLRAQQTIRLSLIDKHALWNGYSQSLRRKLRRIPDGGFRLDTDPPTTDIVRMFEQSYNRHGIRPPIPGERIERWLGELRKRNIAHAYAACHPDGRFAAARVVIRDGEMLYDWLAGADPSVAPSASHWLLHTILARYSNEGCTVFDFMGANTPGVTDFKRSFGGTLTEYHEAEWYRPSLLRHLDAIRNSVRRSLRGMR